MFINLKRVLKIDDCMKVEGVVFEFSDVKKLGTSQIENINIGLDISRVVEERKLLKVHFTYTATYSPSKSYIRLGGFMLFSGSDALQVTKEWLKNKRLSGTIGEQVTSAINYSASINSVFIARVFNLNPPIAQPVIKLGTK